MADWPSVFELYGVDLDVAKEDGVTAEQITYLVLLVTALVARCRRDGVSVSERLQESDYHQRLFSTEFEIKSDAAEPVDFKNLFG